MLLSCGSDDSALPIAITDLVPSRGAEGMRIRIKGNSFGDALTNHAVTFSGQPAAIEEVSNEEIIVIAPEGGKHRSCQPKLGRDYLRGGLPLQY